MWRAQGQILSYRYIFGGALSQVRDDLGVVGGALPQGSRNGQTLDWSGADFVALSQGQVGVAGEQIGR